MMTALLLSGCVSENTNNTMEESDFVATENNAETSGAVNEGTVIEERDGIVYVDGEELSLEKLLAMVGEASKQYRYSSLKQNSGTVCMDYLTRQIISTYDRDLFIKAYDTLSNSYYLLKVSGTSCQVSSSQDDPELYTSLFDYLLRDHLRYYHSSYTIEVDDTSIPGKVCYKVATTRTINEKTVCEDFFVDTNTNLFVGWALWNASNQDAEYVIKEIQYSDAPLINYEQEYELPTEEDNNTYEWYTGELNQETVVEENVSASETVEEAEVEPVEVYGELDYPDDDWRCAGFYINGSFAKLPMTYEELSELGFDKLCNANGMEIALFEPESYMIPAYSFRAISSYELYNNMEESIYPFFVNVAAEEKYVTECMIYSLRFVDYTHENRSGYGELPQDVKICNGISWDTSYDEVIALMGEPDEGIDVSDEEGFSGTLTYYMEDGNSDRYVEIDFFRNSVDEFRINAMPIDAHLITF